MSLSYNLYSAVVIKKGYLKEKQRSTLAGPCPNTHTETKDPNKSSCACNLRPCRAHAAAAASLCSAVGGTGAALVCTARTAARCSARMHGRRRSLPSFSSFSQAAKSSWRCCAVLQAVLCRLHALRYDRAGNQGRAGAHIGGGTGRLVRPG